MKTFSNLAIKRKPSNKNMVEIIAQYNLSEENNLYIQNVLAFPP